MMAFLLFISVRHNMFRKTHRILHKVPARTGFALTKKKSCGAAHTQLLPVITHKKSQINLMHRRDYDDQRVRCADTENVFTQMISTKPFFLLDFPISLANPRSFSSQGLSPFPKATHWVFLSRKSLCWAWCPTPQRCSAPYRAVSPC